MLSRLEDCLTKSGMKRLLISLEITDILRKVPFLELGLTVEKMGLDQSYLKIKRQPRLLLRSLMAITSAKDTWKSQSSHTETTLGSMDRK